MEKIIKENRTRHNPDNRWCHHKYSHTNVGRGEWQQKSGIRSVSEPFISQNDDNGRKIPYDGDNGTQPHKDNGNDFIWF